ncbi:AidA/PixA family protein [Photorhabdus africana]|uniref:AidA/PixA family protein n=1 Tax=Photorhabdus africana TaxID=3097554 RepID=UPI002B414EF1|nr:AidA/PixA family protein [Photorhabdus sp. CRI-LC]
MINASELNHKTISGPAFRPAADVIFIVDVEDILKTYPQPQRSDPRKPTYIQNFHNDNTKSPIYIATHISDTYSSKSALSGDTIRVPLNSNIRWRAISISVNFDYTVLLYNFFKVSGDTLVSLPKSYVSKYQEIPALPPGVDANGWYVPDFVQTEDRFFQSVVDGHLGDSGTNREQYSWDFAIYRKKELYGFFKYDPYIEVY